MILIKNEQINAFLPQSDNDIIDFIIEHLSNEHYEYIADIPSDTLYKMVNNALTRARSHDFNEFEDIVVFISLMFTMAPNFDEEPELKKILSEKETAANERIDKLLVESLNSSWENVQNNYDGDAWFPELKHKENN